MTHVVVERLSDGKPLPAGGPASVQPPEVVAIRVEFGVGSVASQIPSADAFKTVYAVEIPVFSLGGLDSDGVHEFDAASLLTRLTARASQRSWAARIALTVQQAADSVARADLHAEVLYDDGKDTGFSLLSTSTLPGGGRTATFATELGHDAEQVKALSGAFSFRVMDAASSSSAQVTSSPRAVQVYLARYEFEPRS